MYAGDVFADVDAAVARAYGEARLRKSVVRDALFDRTNTGDNTPAFCDLHPVDEPGAARLHVMLKGGGSDNASRVVMLPPGAGRAGVVAEVVRCVREKGANACPPLVVGVGVAPRSTRWPALPSARSCGRWTSRPPTGAWRPSKTSCWRP